MDVINRREAKKFGMKRYFTGKPCPRKHLSDRYTSSGVCVSCNNERSTEFKKAHPEKASKIAASYRSKNRERRNDQTRDWREKNRDLNAELQKRYRASDHGKAVRNFHRSKRRATLKNVACGTEDMSQVQSMYEFARHLSVVTGADWQVDHLTPVSKGGLHHGDNLVLMLGYFNAEKHARILPAIIEFFSSPSDSRR